MYTERINLHKKISDSQKILREKFRKFKQGEHYVQDRVNKVFQPIIEPLNKLVESSNVRKKRRRNFNILLLKKTIFGMMMMVMMMEYGNSPQLIRGRIMILKINH